MIVSGDQFRTLLDAYMRKAFRKGIPPLFVDLKPLYSDPAKAKIIGDLTHSYEECLSSSEQAFDKSATDGREPATAYLWVLYFLAQHYDHQKDHMRALELINKAIEHTPTLIELFLLKGKIFKVSFFL